MGISYYMTYYCCEQLHLSWEKDTVLQGEEDRIGLASGCGSRHLNFETASLFPDLLFVVVGGSYSIGCAHIFLCVLISLRSRGHRGCVRRQTLNREITRRRRARGSAPRERERERQGGEERGGSNGGLWAGLGGWQRVDASRSSVCHVIAGAEREPTPPEAEGGGGVYLES